MDSVHDRKHQFLLPEIWYLRERLHRQADPAIRRYQQRPGSQEVEKRREEEERAKAALKMQEEKRREEEAQAALSTGKNMTFQEFLAKDKAYQKDIEKIQKDKKTSWF